MEYSLYKPYVGPVKPVDESSGIKGKYCSAPFGVFLAYPKGLRILAIQCEMDVNAHVFTPPPKGTSNDSPEKLKWLAARMHLSAADTMVHQCISHFLYTHAVIEPFGVSLQRYLSSGHPVHRIMYSHMRCMIQLNALARVTLINPTGVIPDILSIGPNSNEFMISRYQ